MWNRKMSTTLSIAVCSAVSAAMLAALFAMPFLFDAYYEGYRRITDAELLRNMKTAFIICFYPSEVFGGIAMYSLIRLLINIRRDNTFIRKNVLYLFTISWCCFAVAVICLAGGFRYIPMLVIAVASAFMGVILRVVKNVMQSAVELQQENDLTI